MENAPQSPFLFGEFELDVAGRVLRKNGETVSLHARAFDLLAELVANRDRILSKNELLEKVWEGQIVEENNLTVQISALRKIFGQTREQNEFIATIPGKGYKFVAKLENAHTESLVIENRTFERITVDEDVETEPKMLSAKPRRLLFPALAVVALIAFGVGLWVTFFRKEPAQIDSIAVMPFVYEGTDPDADYLSDGLTEALINQLSQLPKLSVRARASVFRYKGKEPDSRKIGRELSVQAVLLGRIRERGDELTVSLELVDSVTDTQIWGEQYSQKKSDLAKLRTDISRDVATRLRLKINPSEFALKGQTANSEAYQLYLRGRHLWNKRRHEDHLKALSLFERAIAADPKFALAYAAIGDVYAVDTFKMPFVERAAKSREAARQALAVEPDLAEAYTILAKADRDEYNWKTAEEHFKRAIALNPNYPTARQWYAAFLLQTGRSDDALSQTAKALELDPLSPVINSEAAWSYFMARKYDLALVQVERSLELEPNMRSAFQCRQAVYDVTGNIAASLETQERLIEFSKDPPDKQAADRTTLAELRSEFERNDVPGYWRQNLEAEKKRQNFEEEPFYLAFAYAKAGETARALDAIAKAIDQHHVDIRWLKVDPGFDNLRNEPRFADLLRRMNLEP